MKLVFLVILFIVFFIGVRLFGNKLSSETTHKGWYIFWLKSSLFTGLVLSLFWTAQDVYTKVGIFEKEVPDTYGNLSALIVYFLPGFVCGFVMNAGYIFKFKRIIK